MNKLDLINTICEKTGFHKKYVNTILESYIETVNNALYNEESITLSGFGSLSIKQRAERVGVNPKSKEKIFIPAQKTVVFKPSRATKEILNK